MVIRPKCPECGTFAEGVMDDLVDPRMFHVRCECGVWDYQADSLQDAFDLWRDRPRLSVSAEVPPKKCCPKCGELPRVLPQQNKMSAVKCGCGLFAYKTTRPLEALAMWKERGPESPTKTPYQLADLDFLAAMCDNWRNGIKGDRTANDWKEMEPDEPEYAAEILRHLRALLATGSTEEKQKHAAAIACNANILWRFNE